VTSTDELLQAFRPVLKYDSQEAYFADSAAEWTDNPGNVLLDGAGHQIAAAGAGLSPLPPPSARAEWDGGTIQLLYNVQPAAKGPPPTVLVVTVNSPDESTPPITQAYVIKYAVGQPPPDDRGATDPPLRPLRQLRHHGRPAAGLIQRARGPRPANVETRPNMQLDYVAVHSRPNQRLIRLEPNSALSAARSSDGPTSSPIR
jgi:hypothetical protein